jgi:peroxiredoxin
MSYQEQREEPVRGKRRLGDNYALSFCLLLIAVVVINSWYSSQYQSEIVQGADFTLPTISGGNFSLSSYRGKVIVLNFMQTSCQNCRAEISQLKEVWDVYNGKIVMASISVDRWGDSDGVLRAFANSYNASWIWAIDTVGALTKYQVPTSPTTVILDQEGQVRYKHVGFTSASTFFGDVDALIKLK